MRWCWCHADAENKITDNSNLGKNPGALHETSLLVGYHTKFNQFCLVRTSSLFIGLVTWLRWEHDVSPTSTKVVTHIYQDVTFAVQTWISNKLNSSLISVERTQLINLLAPFDHQRQGKPVDGIYARPHVYWSYNRTWQINEHFKFHTVKRYTNIWRVLLPLLVVVAHRLFLLLLLCYQTNFVHMLNTCLNLNNCMLIWSDEEVLFNVFNFFDKGLYYLKV